MRAYIDASILTQGLHLPCYYGGIAAQHGRRGVAIRKAEDEMRFAEECAEEAYTLGVVFSRSEERAGEPDSRA